MKIFNSETEIKEKILANKTVAIHLPYKISEEKIDSAVESIKSIAKGGCDDRLTKAIANLADNPHPDLMYGQANLVSTIMNLNDDVFLPEDTWEARKTPVNTPYNDQHVDVDIIGHIIAARPLNAQGEEITTEEVPGYFDIQVDWVVYKSIFPAIAKEIAEKGPRGEKFVSMECTFSSFDYALFEQSGAAKIIARNEDTAFLTKYLRAYGGTGKYKNYKVGRVLRGFRFNGMGSVDAPANPTSIIKNVEYASSANLEAIAEENKVVLYVTKGYIMKKIETLDQAATAMEELENKNKELEVKASTVDTLTQEKASIANELTVEQGKVTVSTQKITELEAQLTESAAQLEQAKKDLAEKTEALDKIHREAKTNERVSALKELNIEVTDEKRQAISTWSDDQFNSLLEFTKSISKKEKETDVTDPNAVSDAENAASKELDKAKSNEKPDVTNTPGDVETDAQKLEKAAAKLASSLMKRKSKTDQKKD